MGKDDERAGKPIYKEGKVEIRTSPDDIDSHSVWVGDQYFLFQRGCLEQFATITPREGLERSLSNYNPLIPHVLKKESVSPEVFALILARARIKELDTQLSDAYNRMRNLNDKLAEQTD